MTIVVSVKICLVRRICLMLVVQAPQNETDGKPQREQEASQNFSDRLGDDDTNGRGKLTRNRFTFKGDTIVLRQGRRSPASVFDNIIIGIFVTFSHGFQFSFS